MDNHQVCSRPIVAQNYNYTSTRFIVYIANSRRGTAVSESGVQEPLVPKRVKTSLQYERDSRGSGFPVSCRCTCMDLHAHAIIIIAFVS